MTGLLVAWAGGDARALDALLPVVYAELRKIAHARMHAEGPSPHTLETTALVHEAYLRLAGGAAATCLDRTHFYALCARLMRRILVDRARARHSAKRGGRAHGMALHDEGGAVPARDEDLLALDESLERLAAADQRMAEVVQLRYFGGLTIEETARVLGTSRDTVLRDWKTARLWLARELGGTTRAQRAP